VGAGASSCLGVFISMGVVQNAAGTPTPETGAAVMQPRRVSSPAPHGLRGGGAHLWALLGRILAGGDGSPRAARECAGAVGVVTDPAIRRPAGAATDNRPQAPEPAAGIERAKSAKSIGVRSANGSPSGSRRTLPTAPNIATTSGCATAPSSPCSSLCAAPVRAGGAHRCAVPGRIHAGGDGGRRTAREQAGAVGIVPAISERAFSAPCGSRRGGACWGA